LRIQETVYDSLVGTDVLGGPIRKRLGQVKNITLVEQTSCKPLADPAARYRTCAFARSISRLCREMFDPQKFDCVRMPRSGILSPLRMTHSGVLLSEDARTRLPLLCHPERSADTALWCPRAVEPEGRAQRGI